MLKKIILLIILPFMLAITIYLYLRGGDLLIYSWFPLIKRLKIFIGNDLRLSFLNRTVENYIVFSLPDGLWLYSFTCFMILIWRSSASKFKYIWMYVGGVIAICHEIGQGVGIFKGTFDYEDLFTYVIALIIASIISKKFMGRVKIYEKKI